MFFRILAYEAKLRPSGSITIYDKQKIPKNVEVHYVKVKNIKKSFMPGVS